MTDVTIVLAEDGLAARVFIDGQELSGVMLCSFQRGEIARVDLSIAPTQLFVISPPEPQVLTRVARKAKGTKRSKARRGRR